MCFFFLKKVLCKQTEITKVNLMFLELIILLKKRKRLFSYFIDIGNMFGFLYVCSVQNIIMYLLFI